MSNFPNVTAPLNLTTQIGDNGLMSNQRMVLAYLNDKGNFGELRVYHDKWDAEELGYLYDISGGYAWLGGLREHLITLGFDKFQVRALDFSESGMQGRKYVSLDINSGRGEWIGSGKAFIARFLDKYDHRDI